MTGTHKKREAIELQGVIWLTVGDRNLGGHGRISLLRAIGEQGSITHAAKALGMSYKAAWDAVDTMNKLAGAALVERSTGGRGGGSTRLTERGRRLVEHFARIEQVHARFVHQLSEETSDINAESDPAGARAVGGREGTAGKDDLSDDGGICKEVAMQLITVKIDKPETTNFVLGQSHFIKTVEDIHEALVGAVPGIRFGLAFCEASGKCLVRTSGTEPAMIELAARNAMALAAGHSFIVFLGDGFYPVNVLKTLQAVPEVCRIFCATANPTEVVLAETGQGRGILGVVDGASPLGIEGDEDVRWRKDLLRQIGYKL